MIVPCGLTATLPETEKNKLLDKCKELEDRLQAAGVRAKGDYRDNYSPGWKFNHWELKVILFSLSGRVQALAGDVVLCSWAGLFTLTVPLSSQVFK